MAARNQGRRVADWAFDHFLLPLDGRDIRGRIMADARKFRSALSGADVPALATAARADIVMDWNAQGRRHRGGQTVQPPVHGRALALMHVAMFEAMNAIDRRYSPTGWIWSPIATLRTKRRRPAPRHAVLTALSPEQKAGARCAAGGISGRSPKAPRRNAALSWAARPPRTPRVARRRWQRGAG